MAVTVWNSINRDQYTLRRLPDDQLHGNIRQTASEACRKILQRAGVGADYRIKDSVCRKPEKQQTRW